MHLCTGAVQQVGTDCLALTRPAAGPAGYPANQVALLQLYGRRTGSKHETEVFIVQRSRRRIPGAATCRVYWLLTASMSSMHALEWHVALSTRGWDNSSNESTCTCMFTCKFIPLTAHLCVRRTDTHNASMLPVRDLCCWSRPKGVDQRQMLLINGTKLFDTYTVSLL